MACPELLVTVLAPGIHDQFFYCDLLFHQAFLESGNSALTDFFISVGAHKAGNFHHGVRIKIFNSAAVGYDQKHSLLGIVG